ncbi:inositol 1,4,5-trisphosphate receptor-interacting protein [Corythoichthys intestinalis]|uniref:inositol 1,4,5-trisphosphate receptor-interacting protein n=1 Tax=Corythoichthys intestinalis TaxID=161448 RepID=UPI0025A636D2|nr:inositol 1,4,5-trisphosphate receptor-interacting protein [Corythoichthys intestinalis]XP_061794401.1 inositol 1,4,5-trisphosphate receptor-interacting protein-like [Nerophis lumbriciformis]
MQGVIAKVLVVVAATILNHPSIFPRENSIVAEQDEELMLRMREYAERLEKERAKLEAELSQANEGNQWEEAYSWYFWGTLSCMVFCVIEMCRTEMAELDVRAVEDDEALPTAAMVLDKDILSYFCNKCTYSSSRDTGRVREFVEGFADDLLESLRSISDRETDMEVGDFVGIGSMFESWQVHKPPTCDLVVPLSPPDPLDFQVSLWCEASSDAPPNRQGCGTVRVSAVGDHEGGCLCGSTNLGEDMLCLLHGKADKVRGKGHNLDKLLCSKTTSHLAKDCVMKWFQVSLTKAWGRINHKYDFEVTFYSLDAAGALKIRFPSGKSIMVNIIPAVQLVDTDAYLVSHFPSDYGGPPDPFWPLSLAVYERNLLKHFAKLLPSHSCHLNCLQVVIFLHRKQTTLTGANALTDYHWKTVLLHILLLNKPSEWTASKTEMRLQDMLSFMHRSLQEKQLIHVLIGNRKVPRELRLPEIFRKAEPVNLFRDLVLRGHIYTATVRHLQEMLRNAAVLLQEYTPLSSGRELDYYMVDW